MTSMMLEDFTARCAKAPEPTARALFFDDRPVDVNGPAANLMYETFVAVQQLGENLSTEFSGDRMVSASFAGDDQYYFRTFSFDEGDLHCAFWADDGVALESAVERMYYEALMGDHEAKTAAHDLETAANDAETAAADTPPPPVMAQPAATPPPPGATVTAEFNDTVADGDGATSEDGDEDGAEYRYFRGRRYKV